MELHSGYLCGSGGDAWSKRCSYFMLLLFLGGSNKVWIGVGLVGATLWGRCTDDASEIGTAVAREIGLGWRQQG